MTYKAQCEMKHEIEHNPHYITINDEFLFHRTMNFCNWKCVRRFMEEHNFAVKKEKLFAVMQ